MDDKGVGSLGWKWPLCDYLSTSKGRHRWDGEEKVTRMRGSTEEHLDATELSRHIDFCSAQCHLLYLTSNPY